MNTLHTYSNTFGTFSNDHVTINQQRYPEALSSRDLASHAAVVDEYQDEILATLRADLATHRPVAKLVAKQPYVTSVFRHKLVDFLLKMSVRLKILPYVFCRAVRLFDRYLLRRIVLLDQAQLIATTCLWIAAKVHGGNNHFANLYCEPRDNMVRTIADLGYGLGARTKGPNERYRLPKVRELVKLCGLRCNYDAAMFNQMEVHVMQALDWRLLDPAVDDFMVQSHDLLVGLACPDPERTEIRSMKRFMSYAACYLADLLAADPEDLACAVVSIANDVYHLDLPLNFPALRPQDVLPLLKRAVVNAVIRAPPYLLQCFDLRGPQLLFTVLSNAPRPLMLLTPEDFLDLFRSHGMLKSKPLPPIVDKAVPAYAAKYPARPSPHALGGYSHQPPFDERFGAHTPVLPEVTPKAFMYFPLPALPRKVHTPTDMPIVPPEMLHTRHNDSQGSLRLTVLSKSNDIFDHEPPRCGLSTPVSEHVHCKSLPMTNV